MEIQKLIFIGHDNEGSRDIFEKIYSDYKQEINFYVIITKGLYHKRSVISSILHMLKNSSFRFCFNRFLDLINYKLKLDSLEKRCKKKGIKIYKTNDINNLKTENYIKALSPDLIFSTFTMHILKNKIINIPKHGTIGCHLGLLPHQRGLETFFWVLANDEKETGVSVFYMTEKIDKGELLLEEKFIIPEDETVTSIYVKETEITGRLLSQTILMLKNDKPFKKFSRDIPEKYYGMPTSEAYRKFKKLGRKWK